MEWTKLRQDEFCDAVERSNGVCLIPIGCVESHGIHLPLGCDVFHGRYISAKAAEIADVCVFPEIYFGEKSGAGEYPGTIIFPTPLIWQILEQCCSEISRNGFKKIVLLNGHGGNISVLNTFVRSTMKDKKDYVVMTRNDFCYEVKHLVQDLDRGEVFPELTEEDIAYVRDFVASGSERGHACVNETSVMMKISPETVRLDRCDAVEGRSNHKADYLYNVGFKECTRFWSINQPNSYHGTAPYGANERIGEVILKKRIAAQVEACRALKKDDRVLEWNEEWNRSW